MGMRKRKLDKKQLVIRSWKQQILSALWDSGSTQGAIEALHMLVQSNKKLRDFINHSKIREQDQTWGLACGLLKHKVGICPFCTTGCSICKSVTE